MSYAKLKRSVVVGTRIEVLAHWNPTITGRIRTVEKAQGNGYFWRQDGKRLWAAWPTAAEITINEDGSYTILYADIGTATFKVQA